MRGLSGVQSYEVRPLERCSERTLDKNYNWLAVLTTSSYRLISFHEDMINA